MKHLIATILILVVAAGALAEDTFGLWQETSDGYRNWIPQEEITGPFTLLIGLHDPSVPTVGGYEVGVSLPDDILILEASGPAGWINFGGPDNHLVGYATPLPTGGEPFTVLGQLWCLGLHTAFFSEYARFHAAAPASIPGHDGPVIADGEDPDHLIACGFVNGHAEVFMFGGYVAVEGRSWTGVKALFD